MKIIKTNELEKSPKRKSASLASYIEINTFGDIVGANTKAIYRPETTMQIFRECQTSVCRKKRMKVKSRYQIEYSRVMERL